MSTGFVAAGSDSFTATQRAYAQLPRVYHLARLHVNFFQPTQKLVHKTRQGAHARRVYDHAQTPYQRLGATDALAPAKRAELDALYRSLNPLQLRRALEAELDRLWTLATPAQAEAGRPESITAPPGAPAGDSTIAPHRLNTAPGASYAIASVTPTSELTEIGG